jgi:hypothetical protein
VPGKLQNSGRIHSLSEGTVRKIPWILLETSIILLYFIFIGYGYILKVPWLGWGLFFALIALHCIEMKTALKIGRSKGLTDQRIVIKNMLFGLTWWIPLRRGIFDK